MGFTFSKAERKKSKLRLALTGASGAGKTYSALLVAKGLGGKIALIDTERGSASLYCDVANFDVLELDAPYTPERFIQAVEAAENAQYDVIIIDSTTHEWNGIGGVLELVDQTAKAKFGGNTWSAWSVLTPRHQAFVNKLLNSKCHIIVTMRSKTETAQVEENGKKKVVKLGMKSEQRDGIEYEFTTVLDINHEGHLATPSKDRTGLFQDPIKLSEATGINLINWLNSGAEIKYLDITPVISDIQNSKSMQDLQAAWVAFYHNKSNYSPSDYLLAEENKEHMKAKFEAANTGSEAA